MRSQGQLYRRGLLFPQEIGAASSGEWEALAEEFDNLCTSEHRFRPERQAMGLVQCTFGPEYPDDDDATICLVARPPEWTIQSGTLEDRNAFRRLASRAATLGGYTYHENWKAWLAHLLAFAPHTWNCVSGPSWCSAGASRGPDDGVSPPGPWQTSTIDYSTRDHLRQSADACRELSAEAFRLERSPRVSEAKSEALADDAVAADSAGNSGNRARINAYMAEVLSKRAKKISRKEIWVSAGYSDATEFERWQRGASNTTKAAIERFERVLRDKPHLQDR